ncbi:MAG: asparagine synthetase B, partial [Bacteroidia bacterium]
MCGWIVVVGRQGQAFEPSGLARAMAALAHRGPDDSGRFERGAVSMGFQRLAIIDLTPGGHQPMRSADGHHVIVFNGEIFNYRELRSELQGLGQRFVSDSDTEVLLAAYGQWGRRCVDR